MKSEYGLDLKFKCANCGKDLDIFTNDVKEVDATSGNTWYKQATMVFSINPCDGCMKGAYDDGINS